MLTKYSVRTISVFIITAILLSFQSALNAEDGSKEDRLAVMDIYLRNMSSRNAEDESKEAQLATMDIYLRYMPSRGAEEQQGEVGIIEADAEYIYEFKVFDKLPLKFSLDNKYIGIENTTSVELPAHLVGLTTDIETTLSFFSVDNTYLRLGISPSFYGDDWDFSTSSFRMPVRSLLIYQPSRQWTFLAGLAVCPDFTDEVLPILGFIYKPNDKLVFNIVPKRPNISYFLNDRVTLFAEGGRAYNSEFEVTRDNLKNVVLRYKETHLGAGIKYKVNKYMRSSLSYGGIFNRSLKYRDSSLGKVKIKSGLYAEFRLEIKI